jgi:hypothetical protein
MISENCTNTSAEKKRYTALHKHPSKIHPVTCANQQSRKKSTIIVEFLIPKINVYADIYNSYQFNKCSFDI